MLRKPHDLCYSWFVPEWRENHTPRSIIVGGWTFYSGQLIKAVKRLFHSSSTRHLQIDVPYVFNIKTRNHWNLSRELLARANNDKCIIWSLNDKYNDGPDPNFEAVSSLDRIRILLLMMATEVAYGGYKKYRMRESRQAIWEIYLLHFFYRRVFKHSKIKAVYLFNDHSPVYRAMQFAAKSRRVKTVYIPHASAGDRFPALDYDYAFLEGKKMLETYKNCGPLHGTTCRLVGNIRINRQSHTETDGQNVFIGIAFSVLDDLDSVKKLIVYLLEQKEVNGKTIQIILRPHPGLRKSIDINSEQVQISVASKEKSDRFLSRIDTLIAGVSNIHLEAILKGIPSIQFDYTKRNDSGVPVAELDNYGFIDSGLIKKVVESKNELFKDLKRLESENFIIEKKILKIAGDYDESLNMGKPAIDLLWNELKGFNLIE